MPEQAQGTSPGSPLSPATLHDAWLVTTATWPLVPPAGPCPSSQHCSVTPPRPTIAASLVS